MRLDDIEFCDRSEILSHLFDLLILFLIESGGVHVDSVGVDRPIPC